MVMWLVMAIFATVAHAAPGPGGPGGCCFTVTTCCLEIHNATAPEADCVSNVTGIPDGGGGELTWVERGCPSTVLEAVEIIEEMRTEKTDPPSPALAEPTNPPSDDGAGGAATTIVIFVLVLIVLVFAGTSVYRRHRSRRLRQRQHEQAKNISIEFDLDPAQMTLTDHKSEEEGTAYLITSPRYHHVSTQPSALHLPLILNLNSDKFRHAALSSDDDMEDEAMFAFAEEEEKEAFMGDMTVIHRP